MQPSLPVYGSVVLIPFDTLIKRYPISPENIQGAANRQVNFSAATGMNLFQVVKTPGSASIGHWY